MNESFNGELNFISYPNETVAMKESASLFWYDRKITGTQFLVLFLNMMGETYGADAENYNYK